ncbi:MAG: hypothetical protein K8953_12680, partial [Proteobacteria bacterium]|nr:hypothetical protein [Pseudomonadota bacterium]
DTYLGARQSACAGQDIADPSDGRCVSILSTLCESDPFDNAAGVGAMTIDCTVGETYKPQRDTACRANPVAYGDGCDALKVPICEATPLDKICRGDERYVVEREKLCTVYNAIEPCRSVIDYRCEREPLNPSAGVGTVKYDCAENINFTTHGRYTATAIARVALCKNPDNSEDPLCLVPTTLAFITTCANDPWDSSCLSFGDQYADERKGGANDRIVACRADVNRSGCDNTTVRDELCIATEKPFAPFCGANDGITNVAARVDFCSGIIDNSEPADPRCDIVTAEFCPTAVGEGLFKTICNATDYDLARVAACRANVGADGGCVDLLKTNCPVTDTPSPECAIATAAVWENHAVNSDNTAKLIILDEVGADDPMFNYVKAGADGLELGVVLDENDNLQPYATINERVLKLYDAGTHE